MQMEEKFVFLSFLFVELCPFLLNALGHAVNDFLRNPPLPRRPKEEIPSPNVTHSSANDTLEDDERIDQIVLGPSPAKMAADEENLVSKKKGKKPMRGRN